MASTPAQCILLWLLSSDLYRGTKKSFTEADKELNWFYFSMPIRYQIWNAIQCDWAGGMWQAEQSVPSVWDLINTFHRPPWCLLWTRQIQESQVVPWRPSRWSRCSVWSPWKKGELSSSQRWNCVLLLELVEVQLDVVDPVDGAEGLPLDHPQGLHQRHQPWVSAEDPHLFQLLKHVMTGR